MARLTIALRKEIPIYKNARARIRSTGIIGTKFLAFYPGRPEPGLPDSAQRLENGGTILGEDAMDIEELVERLAKSVDQLTGGGKLGENLNATMANLRSITDSLNAALGHQKRSLVEIVRNVESFSSYAKSAAAHLNQILADNKENLKV